MLIDTLVLDDGPGETRTAAFADGRLFDVAHHRDAAPSKIGAIYRGRVRRIMPSLNVAFVDLGDGPDGFLRANGVRWPDDGPQRLNRILQEGAALTVQVTRDAVADKGPVVTSLVRIPGRFMDYCPDAPGVRCASEVGEATKHTVRDLLSDGEGAELRCEADADASALAADVDGLRAAWGQVKAQADRETGPARLLAAPTASARALRACRSQPLTAVRTNSLRLEKAAREWCERFRPELADTIVRSASLEADGFDIDAAIDAALAERLRLPDGTELLFDAGEVLTAVDVNSGGAGTSPDRAALEVNMAALPEIARQLRLRRIGGAIVIDLLKMRDRAHGTQVVAAFRELVATDPAGCHVLGLSALGLLELTRRRTGPSLAEELQATPALPGLRPDAAAYRVLRRLRREAGAQPGAGLAIEAAPPVAEVLATALRDVVAATAIGRTDIRARADWPTDRFDVRRQP